MALARHSARRQIVLEWLQVLLVVRDQSISQKDSEVGLRDG